MFDIVCMFPQCVYLKLCQLWPVSKRTIRGPSVGTDALEVLKRPDKRASSDPPPTKRSYKYCKSLYNKIH